MPVPGRLLAYLGIALAVSFDGLAAGVLYGSRNLLVPTSSLASVSLLTALLMSSSMGLGHLLEGLLPPGAAQFWGGVIIVALGMLQGFQTALDSAGAISRPGRQSPDCGDTPGPTDATRPTRSSVIGLLHRPLDADLDFSGTIDWKEAIFLGFALGLDAFAAGFGASLGGFSWFIVPLVAVCSPAFLALGCIVGRAFRRSVVFGRLRLLPSLILIWVGLFKIAGRF